MIHRPFSTALVDLLLGTVVLLLLMVNPVPKDDTPPLAPIMVRMDWNPGVDIDMDLYLLLPDKTAVWYSYKNHGWVNVDRDDLGLLGGSSPDNWELVFIRTPKPGRYYVTVHNFSCKQKGCPVGYVSVQVLVHGSRYTGSTIPMPDEHQEVPIVWFDVDDKGNVVASGESTEMIRKAGKAHHNSSGGQR